MSRAELLMTSFFILTAGCTFELDRSEYRISGSCGRWRLPDTGQDKCYNELVDAACRLLRDFPGQDAEYSANPQSLTDNGDGTVADDNTCLVWQREADNETITQEGASSYCKDLPLAGGGWRLPDVKELSSIVNRGRSSPAVAPSDFPDTPAGCFWTSTAFATSAGKAWNVLFSSGAANEADKGTMDCFARCVRGSRWPAASLADNKDRTVSDGATNLTWQQSDDGNSRTWKDALSYCEDLKLGGSQEWRLPNVIELQSIVDYSKKAPSLDTTGFTNTKSDWYWSSSSYMEEPGQAWGVYFETGEVGYGLKDGNNYVRCVRSGR